MRLLVTGSSWGWTPESFAAVGTVGALAATAGVLMREAFARVRAQAERVVVWIDRGLFHDGESRTEGLFLYIRNDSALPITDIHVQYTGGSADYPVIAPGKEIQQGLDLVVPGTVDYSDAAGRRWRRPLRGGQPRRVRRRPRSPSG
jgi:hypothetical protein